MRAVSLADTVGTATPAEVGSLYEAVKDAATGIELGVHLHSRPESAEEKILAAYEAGLGKLAGLARAHLAEAAPGTGLRMSMRSNSASQAVIAVSGSAAACAKPTERGLWPTMRSSLERMGVSETELFKQCDAAFKQGRVFGDRHAGNREGRTGARERQCGGRSL